MKYPKKIWSELKKSKTMVAECPEELIQNAVEDYLTIKKIDYIRVPDNVFRWIKLNAPTWFQKYFFKIFGGRPDLTLIDNFGHGLGMVMELELKTQDKYGNAVGRLHGKQKHNSDRWIICRSVDQAVDAINNFIVVSNNIKVYISELLEEKERYNGN